MNKKGKTTNGLKKKYNTENKKLEELWGRKKKKNRK